MILHTFFLLKMMQKRQWASQRELKDVERKRIRYIISHAYRNVPYYRRKWKEKKIRPEDIKTVDDLKKLPVLTRDEVVKNYRSFFPRDLKVTKKILTSGTSESPLKILLDERSEDYRTAIFLRTYISLGYDIRKPLTYYWYEPFERKFYHYIGFLKKNFIDSSWNEDRQIKTLLRLNPEYLVYFPTTLFSIAKRIQGHRKLSPRFIATQGEVLTKNMRKVIEGTFDSPVYDLYGTAEGGIIAWQCLEKNEYHINSDNVLVEFIKDGEMVDGGEVGEMVITTLTNFSFPLIRYNIGDLGVPSDNSCECGRSLPLMESIEGRKKDTICLKSGKSITSKKIMDILYGYDKIRKFRLVELGKSEFRIDVVFSEKNDWRKFSKTRNDLKRMFNEKVHIKINVVRDIPIGEGGKMRTIKKLSNT